MSPLRTINPPRSQKYDEDSMRRLWVCFEDVLEDLITTSGSIYAACSLWQLLTVSRHHVHTQVTAGGLPAGEIDELAETFSLIYDHCYPGLRPSKFIIYYKFGQSSDKSPLVGLLVC